LQQRVALARQIQEKRESGEGKGVDWRTPMEEEETPDATDDDAGDEEQQEYAGGEQPVEESAQYDDEVDEPPVTEHPPTNPHLAPDNPLHPGNARMRDLYARFNPQEVAQQLRQSQPAPAAPGDQRIAPADRPFQYRSTFAEKAPVGGYTLNLRPPSFGDVDRLWDWSRTDREDVMRFLGKIPTHSQELYEMVGLLQNAERQGLALFRTIVVEPTNAHLGFVMLHPIDRSPQRSPVAAVHLYLMPAARGSLPALLPSLMQLAERDAPGVALTVFAESPAWAKLLESAGFTPQLVLTRRATNGNGHGHHG